MKKAVVAAVIAGTLFSFEAAAQERAGSAALGAVSGAVVLGPVGAVAGAVIGYTAGPSIARSWGICRSASRLRARHATASRGSAGESGNQDARAQSSRVPDSRAKNLGANAQAVGREAPPAVTASERLPVKSTTPPVQGFE